MRYDGSTWRILLRLDEDEAEGDEVEAVAASGDGTVWALSDGERCCGPTTMGTGTPSRRRTGLGVWLCPATRSWSAPTRELHRVAGDQLELVWSPQQGRAVVPDLMDVVTVSGDEAWIVIADWPEFPGPPPLHMQRVQVGRTEPVLVASLPASAVNAYLGSPPSALGAAAVAASDGAIWYVTDESVVRIADGTESVVTSGLGEYLLGEQVLNVNVVAMDEGGRERADPRPREIGPDGFAELTVPGKAIEQTLYGDGDITCPDHWAHDLSLPVGQVQYTPTPQAIEITVTLTQAWPDTEYDVDVNTDQFCRTGGSADSWDESDFGGLTTDRDGAGSLTLTYAPAPAHVGLLAGDDGAVWLLATARRSRWFADPEEGGRTVQADWAGLCRLTPDGECTPAELPLRLGTSCRWWGAQAATSGRRSARPGHSPADGVISRVPRGSS